MLHGDITKVTLAWEIGQSLIGKATDSFGKSVNPWSTISAQMSCESKELLAIFIVDIQLHMGDSVKMWTPCPNITLEKHKKWNFNRQLSNFIG